MAYLTASTPRWQPTTQEDLSAAITAGLLEETHYLDLKREVGAGAKANKELARDLAQFAIDGGTLIIGVAEHQDAVSTLHPVATDGLPERIEQVARMACEPPLPVTVHVIASDQPGLGYLIVEVPATGVAPHMVDGAYFGRGDKTKQRLSDAEVLRLHHARASQERTVEQLLDGYVARDPVPAETRRNAHLFVVLAPISPRREMALRLVTGEGWQERLMAVREAGRVPQHLLGPDRFSPDIGYAGTFARRADGVALSSGLTPDRLLETPASTDPRRSERVLEIEVSENGVVRLMTSRFSDAVVPHEPEAESIFVNMMPTLVRRAISMASKVAEECGYLGGWFAGVAATGLAGQSGSTGGHGWFLDEGRQLSHDQTKYWMTTTASLVELTKTPGTVTRTLTGRFLRSLGQEPLYAALLQDPAEDISR